MQLQIAIPETRALGVKISKKNQGSRAEVPEKIDYRVKWNALRSRARSEVNHMSCSNCNSTSPLYSSPKKKAG